jgi:hypothetical protein
MNPIGEIALFHDKMCSAVTEYVGLSLNFYTVKCISAIFIGLGWETIFGQ